LANLKLGPIADDKPVRVTAELPAAVHRDLVAYAEVLGRATGKAVEPGQLVAPMLARFMATDREFAKARRSLRTQPTLAKTGSAGAPSPEAEKQPESA